MRSLFVFVAAFLALTAVTANAERIVCYFGSWSVYRVGDGKFSIEDIDPKMCTHLIYTFVGLDGDKVKVLDSWQDLAKDGGKDGFRRFNDLRKQNPQLKTLIAIGGWNEGSTKYSAMAADPAARSRFIDNVISFVEEHGFDGFDLDWEYPCQRGGPPNDKKNFALLTKEMKARFVEKGLILSAAVGAAESSASESYDIAEISKNLDFINLMAYDLHGSWDEKTGMNAPLKATSSESGNDRQLNIEAIVDYWISQGADPKKLNLGVGTYGRSFTLANPSETGVGAPTRGPGTAGPYTRENGMLGYNEICEDQDWEVKFDEERRVPFAHKGNQWVGFDNVKSIKEKAEFVKAKGLGGAMVWSIETDDFKGKCGEKFGLVKALGQVLRGGDAEHVNLVPVSTPKKPSGPQSKQPHKSYEPNKPNQPHKPYKPYQPQQPNLNHNDNSICTQSGNMADETNPNQFIMCNDNGNGNFRSTIMQCPGGLVYVESLGICSWP